MNCSILFLLHKTAEALYTYCYTAFPRYYIVSSSLAYWTIIKILQKKKIFFLLALVGLKGNTENDMLKTWAFNNVYFFKPRYLSPDKTQNKHINLYFSAVLQKIHQGKKKKKKRYTRVLALVPALVWQAVALSSLRFSRIRERRIDLSRKTTSLCVKL